MNLLELADRARQGIQKKAEKDLARKTAKRYSAFVDQNRVLSLAAEDVYGEVNEFLAAVVTDGNGQRKAFLRALATLPTPILTETLMIYLQRGEGSTRGEWFPDVVGEVEGHMQGMGKAGEAEELFKGLKSYMHEHLHELNLTENVQDAIIGCLSEHVVYEPFRQTRTSASITHS